MGGAISKSTCTYTPCMDKMETEETYVLETIVQGYHAYKELWEAAIGDALPCQRERGNMHDPYAVALVKEGVTVGHIPRTISSVWYFYLGKGGSLSCEVTGTRHYSKDLPQRWLRNTLQVDILW